MASSQSEGLEGSVGLPHTDRMKKSLSISILGLALGLAVEILFFGQPWGINFFAWSLLAAGALLIASRLEEVDPARYELLLLIPILVPAFFTFIRLEPLTVVLCVIVTLAGFALWVRTFRSDRLFHFGWIDFLLALIWVPLEAWLRPWSTLNAAWLKLFGGRGAKSRWLAALRGILLALPVLIIFIALLAAADLVFGDFVESALAWLNLEVLAEYTGRILLILVSAVFFLGAIVASLRDPGERELIGERQPILKPFLGFIESTIILAAVDLLFLAFVMIQFAYLFGGEANITSAGYTYSEYARRGFGELVAVAFLSLGMIMVLGYWGRREDKRQVIGFNALSTMLVLLLGVMLASAMMRLALYEEAYGFTRLRAYTHVFIIWLAVLLAAFMAVLLRGQLRRFAAACALGVVGFTVTLALLNVDAFIVKRNMNRLSQAGEIDVSYLSGLSSDAVPGLVELLGVGGEEVQDELLPQLACMRYRLERRQEEISWPSYHLSQSRAYAELRGLDALDAYRVYPEDWSLIAEGPGGETTCTAWAW
jgi:hypothetical protein